MNTAFPAKKRAYVTHQEEPTMENGTMYSEHGLLRLEFYGSRKLDTESLLKIFSTLKTSITMHSFPLSISRFV